MKIDQSFLAQLATSSGSTFLDALIHLGKTLGLMTIAEGIEQVSQLRHVKREGCDWGQGFLFSKPLPAEEIEQIIQRARYDVPGAMASAGTNT